MARRIIVCGGRDFSDRQLCFEVLDCIRTVDGEFEIVSGHAKGADTFGEEYAEANGVKVTIFKPDWKKYGKAAGPIRNGQMLAYALENNPLVIAFWNGKSRGTKNMIEQARKAGAEVRVVGY